MDLTIREVPEVRGDGLTDRPLPDFSVQVSGVANHEYPGEITGVEKRTIDHS